MTFKWAWLGSGRVLLQGKKEAEKEGLALEDDLRRGCSSMLFVACEKCWLGGPSLCVL